MISTRLHRLAWAAVVPVAALAVLLTVGTAQASARPAHDRRITVFVAGDSTAATWPASRAPQSGWGQALPAFLGRQVAVVNEALSGASSKSFVDLGLLDRIDAAIRPGDYLLISFGHNDEKDDVARHTDPFTTFQDYLRRYLDVARAHGAHPVLVTPVERRRFDAAGAATRSHGDYPAAMIQLGAMARVPTIDLTTSSLHRWDRLGTEGTKDYFLWLNPGDSVNYPDGLQDNTHFKAHGAIEVARLVARGLAGHHLLPRHSLIHLSDPVPDSVLSWPVDIPA
jgi:lysophospholipase L1-like esterase